MPAAVETMAYVGQKPWHGLGEQLPPNPSTQHILEAAGLDWNVVKTPLHYVIDGVKRTVADQFGLVRETDGAYLSTCGKDYIPIQNKQIFDFFRRFTEKGEMTMETAGSLRGGRHIWALAKIGSSFKLADNDEVADYLLFSQPHEYGIAWTVKLTAIRTVCGNTLQMALKDPTGEATAFKQEHTVELDSALMDIVEETITGAKTQAERFKAQAELLSKTPYKPDDAAHLIAELFQPELLKGEDEFGKTLTVNPVQFKTNAGRAWEALSTSPGSQLKSAKNTWWGVVNAVTYVVDHRLGRKSNRDAALHNAWFGSRGTLKTRALEAAVEYAEAA